MRRPSLRLTERQRKHLISLEDKRGRITAAHVFNDARSPRSPLHSLYDWNIENAARAHWMHRTAEIIASVRVQVTTTEATISAPAYVIDTDRGGYIATVKLKDDVESATETLVYTLEVAAGHLRRAYAIAAPLGLSKRIDDLLARIAGVQRIVTKKKVA